MVIAVPTGIKVFSWLSKSFSKTYMTEYKQNLTNYKVKNEIVPFTTIVRGWIVIFQSSLSYLHPSYAKDLKISGRHKHSLEDKEVYISEFPVTNRSIVKYGGKGTLSSTVGLKYTSFLKKIVNIPTNHMNIIIGILISDGNLSKGTNFHARMQFKQSLKNIYYFYFVYSKLNHYCLKGAYIS